MVILVHLKYFMLLLIFMAHGRKYGKKGPNRGGRDTNKNLDFVVAEEVEEDLSLDDKLMRRMAVELRVHRDEVGKLRVHVGPDYSDKEIRKDLGRLVGREKLKYNKGTYYLDI